MKSKQNYLNIIVPKADAFAIKTQDDFINLHGIILAVAKRGTGKSVALGNILRMMKLNNALDILFIISPTLHNNRGNFDGLEIDENLVFEPEVDTAAIIMEMIEDLGKEYDQYHTDIEKWKQLQTEIRSQRAIHDIDENLLLYFENMEKPKYRFMKNGQAYKPSIGILIDDCMGSKFFSPRSRFPNMCTTHRHLGKTIHGSLGCTILMAVQSYKSANSGLPKLVRYQVTHMLLFKTQALDEKLEVQSEMGGNISLEAFLDVYDQAIIDPHDFLFIDLHPKPNHPSMFRRNMNEFIIPKINI
jgi:hypothetical protein